MRKVVFIIDGWFMNKRIKHLQKSHTLQIMSSYSGPEIREYCCKHLREGDQLYRIFYYDTEPLLKKGVNPISRESVNFGKSQIAVDQNQLLESIKKTPNFVSILKPRLIK